jgi:glycerate 2-kinase
VQVLVAPTGFSRTLRATEVAAAIGRGLEAAGLEPPDLCPVADGGPGTLEVLLTRLGGESLAASVGERDGRPVDVGFGLVGDGSTAIVELAAIRTGSALGGSAATPAESIPQRSTVTRAEPAAASSWAIGELIAAAAGTGADVVVVAAGGTPTTDAGAGAVAAIEAAGGLGGSRIVVVCAIRPHFTATGRGHGGEPGGIGEALTRAFGAVVEPGAQFVLDAVGFDARMRAARAVIVGEGLLDVGALAGRVFGEAATRARQAGVPTHAIVGVNRLDRFDARILDLQEVVEAPTLEALTDAATTLAGRI